MRGGVAGGSRALDANLGGGRGVITWHDRIHLFLLAVFYVWRWDWGARHYYDMADGNGHGVLGRVVTR